MIGYYSGGYVAGRMSRFSGTSQGLGVWITGFVVTLAMIALGAIFGQQYDILSRVNLPRLPVTADALSTGGIIAALAVLGGHPARRARRRHGRHALPLQGRPGRLPACNSSAQPLGPELQRAGPRAGPGSARCAARGRRPRRWPRSPRRPTRWCGRGPVERAAVEEVRQEHRGGEVAGAVGCDLQPRGPRPPGARRRTPRPGPASPGACRRGSCW